MVEIKGTLDKSLPSLQVGFMKTGRIVALEVDHFSNAGNSMDLSQGVSRTASCTGVTGRSRACPTACSYRQPQASSILACYYCNSFPVGPRLRVLHPWLISEHRGDYITSLFRNSPFLCKIS